MDEKTFCLAALVICWVVVVVALIWMDNRAGIIVAWIAGGFAARAGYDLKMLLGR